LIAAIDLWSCGHEDAAVSRKTPELGAVASVTQRLAVLLAAGVSPASAWRHVAASTVSPVASAVAASGVDPARVGGVIAASATAETRLASGGWRGLAAAWSIATDAGAPLAPALRDYAESLRALTQAQREIAVALAAPVGTARLVMALPVVGILFGILLGFDTARTLFATPIGWGCIVIGGGLMLLAARWNRRLVAAAQPMDAAPGIECDLMAIAVSGGGSLVAARTLLDRIIREYGLPARTDRLDEVLELSRRAGVPAAELLRSEAQEVRRAAQADAQEKAAELSVRLMLPLGICVLPAFMVLGVLPLMVAVISSTVATF
jgi:tight adherence protein B